MYTTPDDTALLLAGMLHRSGKTRGRVSEKTIRILSRRKHLKSAFIEELRCRLEDYGILMVQLDRGGYALVAFSALDGAPTMVAKTLIPTELTQIRQGNLDRRALYSEIGIEEFDDED